MSKMVLEDLAVKSRCSIRSDCIKATETGFTQDLFCIASSYREGTVGKPLGIETVCIRFCHDNTHTSTLDETWAQNAFRHPLN